MLPSDIGFLMYVTCINMLDALKGFDSSQYEHVDMRRIHKRETLPMRHREKTQTVKTLRN